MNAPTRPTAEIARLGDEIYERDIRAHVESEHHGKIVAIDVDSGDYAIGDGIIEASDRLRAAHPDARVRFVRIGCRAVHRFGNIEAELANGSWDDFDVYGVSVLWDGQPRYVPADEADSTPLIGMDMLARHSLYVEVEDAGRVLIQAR